MELKAKRAKYFYSILFGLFSLVLLLWHEYEWRWVETMSTFATDEFFFRSFLRIPGGLLAYAGSFLTQFLYLPAVGCLLFVALLFGVQRLTARAFRISDAWYAVSFVPSCLLLTAVLNVGYTWATLKAPGHFFMPALGCCLMLLSVWGYRSSGRGGVRAILLAEIIATYPLFGFYALFCAGLCLVHEVIGRKGKLRFLLLPVGCALLWLIPQFCYYTADGTEQEISRLYVAGLPPFFIRRAERMLWMPYLLLFGGYALMALSAEVSKRAVTAGAVRRVLPVALYGAALFFAWQQTYRDANFEASVRSSLAIAEGDWEQALKATSAVKQHPTRCVVTNRQMALARLGKPIRQEEMPAIPASYKDARPGLLTFMQLCGLQMHYYGGQLNQCYRWAMELSVEYGWRVGYLKLLVKSALLNGETELARKYNDRLKKSLFHKKWADRYQLYIDHPEQISNDPELSTIPHDPLPNRFVE